MAIAWFKGWRIYSRFKKYYVFPFIYFHIWIQVLWMIEYYLDWSINKLKKFEYNWCIPSNITIKDVMMTGGVEHYSIDFNWSQPVKIPGWHLPGVNQNNKRRRDCFSLIRDFGFKFLAYNYIKIQKRDICYLNNSIRFKQNCKNKK